MAENDSLKVWTTNKKTEKKTFTCEQCKSCKLMYSDSVHTVLQYSTAVPVSYTIGKKYLLEGGIEKKIKPSLFHNLALRVCSHVYNG